MAAKQWCGKKSDDQKSIKRRRSHKTIFQNRSWLPLIKHYIQCRISWWLDKKTVVALEYKQHHVRMLCFEGLDAPDVFSWGILVHCCSASFNAKRLLISVAASHWGQRG